MSEKYNRNQFNNNDSPRERNTQRNKLAGRNKASTTADGNNPDLDYYERLDRKNKIAVYGFFGIVALIIVLVIIF